MQLFIKSLIGKTISIDIEPYNTIEDIKFKISKKENIYPNQQKLTYFGKQLNNNLTISEYGIQKETTLQLSLCLMGGGIPRFFSNIMKKYDDLIELNMKNTDYFYIDFNSIIYEVIPEIKEQINFNIYENILIEHVIKYLNFIIKYVNPSKLVYIAMDGPAPMAKIIKQRARRYKSVIETNYKKNINNKYGIKNKNTWTTSSISPGTIFMDKLCKKISSMCTDKIKFSNCYEAGEGEHKIINYIKINNKIEDKIVIYSPDADLIILSAMLDNNIYILRKNPEIVNEFIYLSIDKCKYQFYNEISCDYNKQYLIDYVFLTFMCGNDFVPSNHFLKIKENGLDILIKIYNKVKNDEFLVNDKKINIKFLKNIFYELKNIEQEMGCKIQRKINRIRRQPTNYFDNMIGIEKDLCIYQHAEYYNPIHPEYDLYNKLFDMINYYDENWIKQYNSFYFKNENINDVCDNYIKSLEFCLNYYFGIVNWEFYYKYRTTPTFNDLYDYLGIYKSDDIVTTTYPLTPFEQLLIILPTNYKFLLPKSINNLIENLFFNLDIVQGTKFIYTDPILPDIDISLIKNKLKNKEFTQIEKNRNKVALIN